MTSNYINTDLELKSETDLTPLLTELEDKVYVLRNDDADGLHTVWLETGRDYPDAESTLNEFCRLLEGLSGDARQQWHGCKSRIANIGFESGTESSNFSEHMPLQTLQRLINLGIALTITIYPVPPISKTVAHDIR